MWPSWPVGFDGKSSFIDLLGEQNSAFAAIRIDRVQFHTQSIALCHWLEISNGAPIRAPLELLALRCTRKRGRTDILDRDNVWIRRGRPLTCGGRLSYSDSADKEKRKAKNNLNDLEPQMILAIGNSD